MDQKRTQSMLALTLVFSVTLAQPSEAPYVVQVGGFGNPQNAQRAVNGLKDKGYSAFTQPVAEEGEPKITRVLVGPYPEEGVAGSARQELRKDGWDGFVRTYEPPRLASTRGEAWMPARPQRVERPRPDAGGGRYPSLKALQPSSSLSTERVQGGVDERLIADSTDGLPAGPETGSKLAQAELGPEVATTLDSLFGMEDIQEQEEPGPRVRGFFQNELAYTYPDPSHWSKFRNILQLETSGRWNGDVKWNLSGRASYDAIYDLDDFYPGEVRDDQQWEFSLRETYMDVSAGDWDFRFGRQHIIWGEMVGLFFADVVSAKDMREFVLPDFDMLRIPQWAARAEYYKDDFHAEAIWIPYMTYDEIGEPGSDFYPSLIQLPGFALTINNDDRPTRNLDNMAYGLKLSYLLSGWDTALFYYDSPSASPAFERQVSLAPARLTYTPKHYRSHQWGATFAKDFGSMVLKGEAIYNSGRRFSVTQLADTDGLVHQDYLDYVLGFNFSFPKETRFNLQFYQRIFRDHDPDIIPDEVESGFTVLVNTKAFDPRLEAEALLVRSLNRSDWLFQPKLTWRFPNDWRLVGGADIFSGPEDAMFGQYDDNDRVYSELRYSF